MGHAKPSYAEEWCNLHTAQVNGASSLVREQVRAPMRPLATTGPNRADQSDGAKGRREAENPADQADGGT
jgi:hypothetical protein